MGRLSDVPHFKLYYTVNYRLEGSMEVRTATFHTTYEAIKFIKQAHAGFIESHRVLGDEEKAKFEFECENTQYIIKRLKRAKQLKK